MKKPERDNLQGIAVATGVIAVLTALDLFVRYINWLASL